MKTQWDYCALVSSVAVVHSPGLPLEASLFHPENFKRGIHANISAKLTHRGRPQLQGSAELSGSNKIGKRTQWSKLSWDCSVIIVIIIGA